MEKKIDNKELAKKIDELASAVKEAGGGVFIAIIPEHGSREPMFSIKGRGLEVVQAIACAILRDPQSQMLVKEALKQVMRYEKKFCKDDAERDA